MAKSPKEPTKRLAIDIPEEQHHQLRLYALSKRTTVADILRGMVEEVLSKEERKPQRKGKTT